ncbi:MAG TPA: zf-HC2 domain-containing protein [Gemmatimonadaceae bacterium]|nr:zf-HC2 domain-containing protein [Gemmatimonadaceae bacterium]
MNHLDEGTIHAWLDGALTDEQSTAIEAHIVACESCAGMVAEARGIMAAASRVLRALDDDRVNVVPKPATPGVVPLTQPHRGIRRRAPWIGAVAAVLLAAVVLRTSDLSQDRAASQESAVTSQMPLAGSDAVTPPPPADAAPPAEPEIPPAVSTSVAANAAEPAPQSATRSRSAAKQEVGRVAGTATGPVGAAAVGGASERRAAATITAEAAPSRPATLDVIQPPRSAELLQTEAAKSVADETRLRSVFTSVTMTPTERLAGCYRLDPATIVASVGAGAAVQRAEPTAATRGRVARAPASAPPSAGVAARSDFSDARPALIIRLDTTRAALGLTVIRLPGDSTFGSWGVVGDSARVQLGTRGITMLGASQKIACPE